MISDGTVMTKENSGLVINRSMVRPTSVVEFVPDEAQGDRAALIAFYNATGGPNWKDNTNWCSDEPLDTWHGVTTDSEGRVTEIGLNNNNLSGEAGNTLAPLTALTYLDIYSNNISTLDVSANTALTDLSCGDNHISELDLSHNTALTILYCSDNSLSALDLSDIPGLEVLMCSGNRLTSLDIRNNESLASVEVGWQTDAAGNYVEMYLYVTEAQLEQWNSSWSLNEFNEYVTVSTRESWFDISPVSFDVPAEGGEITVNISTDQDYTIDIVDSEWITLVSGEGVKEGSVVFRVAANTVPSERTGMKLRT